MDSGPEWSSGLFCIGEAFILHCIVLNGLLTGGFIRQLKPPA